jgi:hypothetical protein
VSSANKIIIDLLFITFGKSLMYTKKSRGPRIEPCRTPCLTIAQLENLFETVSYIDTLLISVIEV